MVGAPSSELDIHRCSAPALQPLEMCAPGGHSDRGTGSRKLLGRPERTLQPRPASESPNLGRPLIADGLAASTPVQSHPDANVRSSHLRAGSTPVASRVDRSTWIALADRLHSIAAHQAAELARFEYDAHDQARVVMSAPL